MMRKNMGKAATILSAMILLCLPQGTLASGLGNFSSEGEQESMVSPDTELAEETEIEWVMKGDGIVIEAEDNGIKDETENSFMIPEVPESAEDNKVIIGIDDRIKVQDPFVYPYCAVCYIWGECPYGCNYSGTGFVIGTDPGCVVTAGHVLFCGTHRTACNLTFNFGYKADGSCYYRYDGPYRYWYSTGYIPDEEYTSEDEKWDYAYISLDDVSIASITGSFGCAALNSAELSAMTDCAVLGYRDDILMQGPGQMIDFDQYNAMYTCDMLPGYSGGPVFTPDGTVFGINIAENNTVPINECRLFTQDLFNSMADAGLFQFRRVSNDFSDSSDDYILPVSDSEYISYSDLSGLSKREVLLARNEIYARHGRKFTLDYVREYFESKSWYSPRINPEDFSDSVFNKYEKANILTIVQYEELKGWND